MRIIVLLVLWAFPLWFDYLAPQMGYDLAYFLAYFGTGIVGAAAYYVAANGGYPLPVRAIGLLLPWIWFAVSLGLGVEFEATRSIPYLLVNSIPAVIMVLGGRSILNQTGRRAVYSREGTYSRGEAEESRFERVVHRDADGQPEAVSFAWVDNYVPPRDQSDFAKPLRRPWLGFVIPALAAVYALWKGQWGLLGLAVLVAIGIAVLIGGLELFGATAARFKQAKRGFTIRRDGGFSTVSAYGVPEPKEWDFSIFDCSPFEYGSRAQWTNEQADQKISEVWITAPNGVRFVISGHEWGNNFSHRQVHQFEQAKAMLLDAERRTPSGNRSTLQTPYEPRNVVHGPGGASLSSDD